MTNEQIERMLKSLASIANGAQWCSLMLVSIALILFTRYC